jgi:hypothetical protein
VRAGKSSQTQRPTISASSYWAGSWAWSKDKTVCVGSSQFAVCAAKARVFETDDGRTFTGADASFLKFVVFIAFFLKPLSVTLPFAARFTDWGDSKPCATAH